MYLLYSILLTFGFLILLPRFLFDALRHGKYVAGFWQRMGDLPLVKPNGYPVIWLHCVSVGETQAARPLVESLRRHLPHHQLVVSTITATGQTLARDLFKELAVEVVYFPFDWGFTANRALKRINPSLVLLMETELWPGFLRKCKQSKIPVAVVNGRISERSFRRYRLIRPFISKVLQSLDRAVMQSERDADRIQALGLPAEKTFISGSLKFDAGAWPGMQSLTRELVETFASADRPLLLAASTHAPEERILLQAFKILRQTAAPSLRMLIAPRHPERFGEVATLMAASGHTWSRRTTPGHHHDEDLLLLDTIGELVAAFPLASVVFVGGSISRKGGHNVLEPAAAGSCIITGAHTNNFKTIVDTFSAADALVQLPPLSETEAAPELANTIAALLGDAARRQRLGEAAQQLIKENAGATEKTVSLVLPLLKTAWPAGKRDSKQVHPA